MSHSLHKNFSYRIVSYLLFSLVNQLEKQLEENLAHNFSKVDKRHLNLWLISLLP